MMQSARATVFENPMMTMTKGRGGNGSGAWKGNFEEAVAGAAKRGTAAAKTPTAGVEGGSGDGTI